MIENPTAALSHLSAQQRHEYLQQLQIANQQFNQDQKQTLTQTQVNRTNIEHK
jgi:hypothetical protein